MRILIVDPERERFEKEGGPDGPLSFFFSPDLSGADAFDLLVLPAELFLSRPENLPKGLPILAYGPVELIADALAGGCSDYLREPWPLEELEARCLRFWRIRFSLGQESYLYSSGWLEGGATSLFLPPGERRILELLLHRLGQPVPREAFRRTLSVRDSGASRIPDMTLSRLRKRLTCASGDAQAGAFLVAVRNYGYMLIGKPCA